MESNPGGAGVADGKLGVFSDIHGSDVALQAVLADLREAGVERFVCLGDAIQGGPQPARVVRTLMDLGCPVVMGNADAWLLTGEETGSESVSTDRRRKMEEIRAWTLDQLSGADRDFIRGFQPTVELPLPHGRSFLGFHGSPTSFDDFLFPHTPEEEFQQRLGPFARRILAGGHTHLQQIRRIDTSFFFNPGSVGLVYHHEQPPGKFRADPWAEYAVLTVAGGRVGLEFRRLPYDVDDLLRAYAESSRPHAEEAAAAYLP